MEIIIAHNFNYQQNDEWCQVSLLFSLSMLFVNYFD